MTDIVLNGLFNLFGIATSQEANECNSSHPISEAVGRPLSPDNVIPLWDEKEIRRSAPIDEPRYNDLSYSQYYTATPTTQDFHDYLAGDRYIRFNSTGTHCSRDGDAWIENMKHWWRELVPSLNYDETPEAITTGVSQKHMRVYLSRLAEFFTIPIFCTYFVKLFVHSEYGRRNTIPLKLAAYASLAILIPMNIAWLALTWSVKIIQSLVIATMLLICGIAEAAQWAGCNLKRAAFDYKIENDGAGLQYTLVEYAMRTVAFLFLKGTSAVLHCVRACLQTIFQPIERTAMVRAQVTEYYKTVKKSPHAVTLGRIAACISAVASIGATVALMITGYGFAQLGQLFITIADKLHLGMQLLNPITLLPHSNTALTSGGEILKALGGQSSKMMDNQLIAETTTALMAQGLVKSVATVTEDHFRSKQNKAQQAIYRQLENGTGGPPPLCSKS